MKRTEKAVLISTVFGLAAGFGLTWLLEDANIWVYVIFGVCVAAGVHHEALKYMALERIIDGDEPAKDRS